MKKLSILIVCLVLFFGGASCSKQQLERVVSSFTSAANAGESSDDYTYEDSAIQFESDVTYTNSYLGFSYTISKGWWLYSVNESNFTTDAFKTENPDILDISYGEDAGYEYSFIDLISFANLQDSTGDNHIGIDINAETLEGIDSIEDYMEYYEAYMLEQDENTYELLDSKQIVINNVQYEARYFEVIREKYNYRCLTLTCKVENDYYLTIMTNYWPNNRNAEKIIIENVTKATR